MKKSTYLLLFFPTLILALLWSNPSEQMKERAPANTSRDKTDDQILVFRKGVRPYLIAAPANNRFDIRSRQSDLEIEKLRAYLDQARQSFGISNDSEDFQLILKNVRSKGSNRVFVSFQQVQQRSIGAQNYTIPVSGASIVVTLKNLRIDQVNTGLKSIRKRDFSFRSPGFDFSELSELEFEVLNEQLRRSNNREIIENYFNNVLRRAGLGESFDIDNYLSLSTGEQRIQLQNLFGNLSRIATFRLLINLAQSEKLSLVQYGQKEWMYTIHQPFELDIEFDVAIPTENNEQLKVLNLRVSSYDAEVNLHNSPFYPIELGEVIIQTKENGELVATPGSEPREIDWITARNFKSLQDYFSAKYQWEGLADSSEENIPITIHSQIEGRYRGSARWSATKELFLFGADGRGWKEKGRSLSIVGHEYFHGLIHFSTQLVYRGQTGALNEHLADIHGVIFEADKANNGQFDFSIGDEGVFTTVMNNQLRKKYEEWVQQNEVAPEDIEKFQLKKTQLRHFYFPQLSKHRQIENYQDFLTQYGDDCEPSADNNNCGVHFGSGVLNKALSRLIDSIGYKKLRLTLFNTALYRLSSDSDFIDYGRQLYEECYEQAFSSDANEKPVAQQCEKIINEFSAVGIDISFANNTTAQ